MSLPIGPWRVTYTPGQWLVLAGTRLVVVMQPAPAKMSALVARLWSDMQAAGSLGALMELLRGYSLDRMPDFAAFVWEQESLHGLARGLVQVVDAATGETVLDGNGALTWHEGHLGGSKSLRIEMGEVDPTAVLNLPLVVGAVGASAVLLTTDPDQLVHFPDEHNQLPEPPRQVPAPAPEPLHPTPPPPPPAADPEPRLVTPEESFQRPVPYEPERFVPQGIGVQVNSGEFTNVVGALVVGRAPDPARGPIGAATLRVPSPGNDISRSHVLIEAVGNEARVTDLNSTNGTTVQTSSEEPYVLENGDSEVVPVGTVLNLGDGVSMRIEHAR